MAMDNEYAFISETDSNSLSSGVVKALEEGFELVGGICVHFNSNNGKTYYSQAIIRYKESDAKKASNPLPAKERFSKG